MFITGAVARSVDLVFAHAGSGTGGTTARVERVVDPSLTQRFSPRDTISPMHIDMITTPDMGWQEQALCVQTGADFFFPEQGGSVREAKRICGMCQTRPACLEYALDHGERFGVWGGLSESERLRLARADPR
jgi:WhiB family redox-sensing transcriptional regulator